MRFRASSVTLKLKSTDIMLFKTTKGLRLTNASTHLMMSFPFSEVLILKVI